MSKRKMYSRELEVEAVRLAVIRRNVSQTARELGIDAGALRC